MDVNFENENEAEVPTTEANLIHLFCVVGFTPDRFCVFLSMQRTCILFLYTTMIQVFPPL